MLCRAFEFDQFRNFRVGASWRAAEENLDRAAVLLCEPASQAVLRRVVAALDRFKQGDARREIPVDNAAMNWKTKRNEPLPKHQAQAQHRQQTQDYIPSSQEFLLIFLVILILILIECRTQEEGFRERLRIRQIEGWL